MAGVGRGHGSRGDADSERPAPGCDQHVWRLDPVRRVEVCAPRRGLKLIAIALNKENSLYFNKIGSQIAVRQDVAATDEYKSSNPTSGFFTDLVQYTHFRPAFPEYPQISNQIQVAMEAVMTGQASPEEAMQRYAEAVEGIVGSDRTATR